MAKVTEDTSKDSACFCLDKGNVVTVTYVIQNNCLFQQCVGTNNNLQTQVQNVNLTGSVELHHDKQLIAYLKLTKKAFVEV